jgi:hypothetical protein
MKGFILYTGSSIFMLLFPFLTCCPSNVHLRMFFYIIIIITIIIIIIIIFIFNIIIDSDVL